MTTIGRPEAELWSDRWRSSAVVASFSGLAQALADFDDRRSRGEPARAEDYRDLLADADLVELIYHEFCREEANGLEPEPSGYLRRFPEHRERLGRLFSLHRALDSWRLRDWADPAAWPEPGDEIGPYRIRRALGRGGLARVYLAEQTDLADRPVVLKVSARATAEPQLLARAGHPQIVPVLRHLETADGALHLVCMPFLGGATLADVLAEGRRRGSRPASGRGLLADLDRVAAPEYPAAGCAGPAREIVNGLSYPSAVAWMVARLAEALDHAAERGVAHGDIKPSNILLAADGRPMLFDFNLAVDGRRPEADDPGGTLAYMPPERLRALAGPRNGPPAVAFDRRRADLYGLGLVLLEALTGTPPRVPEGRGSDRLGHAAALAASRAGPWTIPKRARRAIPAGLRPILARCLAPEPADRYARASELAEDLDRWRADRPPAHADEPAWPSRLGRWARRQRLALAGGLLVLGVGTLATIAAAVALRSTLRAQATALLDAFWDGTRPGIYRFRWVGHWQADDDRDDPAESARRNLGRYAVQGPGDWRRRDDVRALADADRDDLESWLLEQTWRLAVALRDRPGAPDDWRRALAELERSPDWAGLGPIVTQRRLLRARLGLPAPRVDRPRSGLGWLESYLRGLEAEPERARSALNHYQAVLEARPAAYWAHYRAAVVACRLGAYDAAADHLRHCLARRPDNPALRTQLASCLYQLDRPGAALAECDRALGLDPDFREAYRARAFIRLQLGQAEAHRADVDRFLLLARTRDRQAAWEFRLDTLSARDPAAPLDPDDAEDPARRFLAADPDDAETRTLLATQLDQLARRANDPARADAALAQYDRALDVDPDHLRARLQRASLRRHFGRPGASADFATLIEHPRLEELIHENGEAIRTFHLVTGDLLRRGEPGRAVAVATRGLEFADRFGQLRGESHYALARALTGVARADRSVLPRIADELRMTQPYDPKIVNQWFAADPIFAGLRPALRPLLAEPEGARSAVRD